MRIAIVHPYPVHGGAVGGVTRVHALVKHLAQRHEVHVFTHSHGDREEEEAAARESAELGVRQSAFSRGRHSWVSKARWAFGRAPYFVGHNRNPALEAALAELGAAGLDAVHLELGYLEPLLHGAGPRCVRVLAEQELMSAAWSACAASRSGTRRLPALHLPRAAAHPRLREGGAAELRSALRHHAGEARTMAAVSGRPAALLPHVVDSRVFMPGRHGRIAGAVPACSSSGTTRTSRTSRAHSG